MKPFREQIAADNTAAFINSLEFAEEHNLNGTVCNAILQDISVAESLSTGTGSTQTYPGIYGSRQWICWSFLYMDSFSASMISSIWLKAVLMIWAF